MSESVHGGNNHWSYYVYTIVLIIGYLSNSLINGIISSTLVDLSYQLKTSIASLSYINLFMGFGYISGALFGVLLKYLNRQLIIIIVTSISVVCWLFFPYLTDLWPIFLCSYLINFGMAVVECASILWLCEMWPSSFSMVLYLSESILSAGYMIGPLLAAPFVEGDVTKFIPDSDMISFNKTTRDSINYSIDRQPNLKYPFHIAGIITLFIPLILIAMYFVAKYEMKESCYKQIDGSKDDKPFISSPSRRTLMIILLAVTMSFTGGLVSAHISFGPTYYQLLPISISAEKASLMLSVVCLFYTIGRLFAILESNKMSVDLMIGYHLLLDLSVQILLYFAQNSELTNWIGSAAHGFAFSSLYVSLIIFAEKYLKVNEIVLSVLVFSDQFLMVWFPFIIGPLIESRPQFLLEFEMCCCIIAIFIFSIIKLTS